MTPENSLLPSLIRRTVPINPTIRARKSLLDDAYVIFDSEVLGRVCLTQKKTPYEIHPADVMVAIPDNKASQLTELSYFEGVVFLRTCGRIARIMHKALGRGFPVVAINQQPECRNIPYKYSEDGTELKVQTLNELHAHVFIEDHFGERYLSVAELSPDSKYDFYDPYAMAFSEGLFNRVAGKLVKLDKQHKISFNQGTFPIGINIAWGEDIVTTLGDAHFYQFIREVQEDIVSIYRSVETMIINDDGSFADRNKRRLMVDALCDSEGRLSDKCRRVITSLIMGLRSSDSEKRKYMRLIKGPALTWAFCENNGCTNINLIPRIISRGNAMEMLGIWVETGEVADEKRLIMQDAYFDKLIGHLGVDLNVKGGPALGRRFQ